MERGNPVAGPSAADTIQAAPFRPTGPTARRRRAVSPARIALLVFGALAALFVWFLFTAKSVRIEVAPAARSVAVDGGFALRLGEVHLLREGRYRVRAAAPGHYDLEKRIDVGPRRNQTVALTLEKLPGRITFEAAPAGATVSIDGEPRGATPFDIALPAGPHVAIASHPRYQSRAVEFVVEGMERAQTVPLTLAPNWADVFIPTQPQGAAIFVDDQPTGVATPGPAQIVAGERRVSAKLAGFKAWTDILHVEAGQRLALPAVTLEKADGILAVASTPPGANVTVDGVYRGVTPLEIALPPGRSHRVRALKVGFAPEERTLAVDSGQRRALSFALAALKGELAIQVEPEDAELWIDGARHGPAAGVVALAATPHEIEIKKDGYAGYRKSVLPQPGLVQELKVRLLTLEEARLAALRAVRTTSEGHQLVLLQPTPMRMGASRREPGRRANETLRTAKLTRLFYMSRHEVTNGQFRVFASGHKSGAFQNKQLDGARQPVVRVSWSEAALYCNWLSRKDGLAPFYNEEFGKIRGFNAAALGYRLPTEAEWAWSARHVEGEEAPLLFAWGGKLPPPERHGNYADRTAAHLVARTIFDYNDNYLVSAPVGTFPANAKGLHDLGGNVAEWVHDFYDIPDGAETVDPLGPPSGEYHVIRGASWQKGTITDLRLSFRDYGADGRHDLGFRIARFAE